MFFVHEPGVLHVNNVSSFRYYWDISDLILNSEVTGAERVDEAGFPWFGASIFISAVCRYRFPQNLGSKHRTKQRNTANVPCDDES